MKYSYFFGICLVLSDAFPQTEIKVTFHSRPNSPVVTFQKSFNNPSRILIGAGFELSWPFAKNITTILKHFKPTERRFKKKNNNNNNDNNNNDDDSYDNDNDSNNDNKNGLITLNEEKPYQNQEVVFSIIRRSST